jgi:hypothetical protein
MLALLATRAVHFHYTSCIMPLPLDSFTCLLRPVGFAADAAETVPLLLLLLLPLLLLPRGTRLAPTLTCSSFRRSSDADAEKSLSTKRIAAKGEAQ